MCSCSLFKRHVYPLQFEENDCQSEGGVPANGLRVHYPIAPHIPHGCGCPSSSIFPDSAARDVMLRFVSQHLRISTEPSSTVALRVERVLPFRHIRQGRWRLVRALMLSKLNDAHEWASLFWSRVTTERCYCCAWQRVTPHHTIRHHTTP
jgi:hypothetical protein